VNGEVAGNTLTGFDGGWQRRSKEWQIKHCVCRAGRLDAAGIAVSGEKGKVDRRSVLASGAMVLLLGASSPD